MRSGIGDYMKALVIMVLIVVWSGISFALVSSMGSTETNIRMILEKTPKVSFPVSDKYYVANREK
jgi:hypothetical protein